MITHTQVVNWSCTKLANFLDERTPNWIVDNVTLEGIMAIHMKVRRCSPEAYKKMIPIMRLVKSVVARRK